MTSLASRNFTAFLGARDRDKTRAFYRDVLGFELIGDDHFALIFKLHNGVLRISPMPNYTPQPFTALGWDVPDIVAAVKELNAAGITFERFDGMGQDELGIWTSPTGAKVAWFKDPDGNVLSVGQH